MFRRLSSSGVLARVTRTKTNTSFLSHCRRRWIQSLVLPAVAAHPSSPETIHQQRYLSTLSTRKSAKASKRRKTTDQSSSTPNKPILLYQRDVKSRNTLPRVFFWGATVHSCYWVWYVADFIPTVNSSPISSMHVSPTIGLAGLTIAVIFNVATISYPWVLLSEIQLDDTKNQFLVRTHSLPFLKPSSPPRAFPVEDVCLDMRSSESQKLLTMGSFATGGFEGHVGVSVQGSRFPYLLGVGPSHEVKQDKLMMKSLVNESFLRSKRNNGPTSDAAKEQANDPLAKARRNKKGKRRRPKW